MISILTFAWSMRSRAADGRDCSLPGSFYFTAASCYAKREYRAVRATDWRPHVAVCTPASSHRTQTNMKFTAPRTLGRVHLSIQQKIDVVKFYKDENGRPAEAIKRFAHYRLKYGAAKNLFKKCKWEDILSMEGSKGLTKTFRSTKTSTYPVLEKILLKYTNAIREGGLPLSFNDCTVLCTYLSGLYPIHNTCSSVLVPTRQRNRNTHRLGVTDRACGQVGRSHFPHEQNVVAAQAMSRLTLTEMFMSATTDLYPLVYLLISPTFESELRGCFRQFLDRLEHSCPPLTVKHLFAIAKSKDAILEHIFCRGKLEEHVVSAEAFLRALDGSRFDRVSDYFCAVFCFLCASPEWRARTTILDMVTAGQSLLLNFDRYRQEQRPDITLSRLRPPQTRSMIGRLRHSGTGEVFTVILKQDADLHIPPIDGESTSRWEILLTTAKTKKTAGYMLLEMKRREGKTLYFRGMKLNEAYRGTGLSTPFLQTWLLLCYKLRMLPMTTRMEKPLICLALLDKLNFVSCTKNNPVAIVSLPSMDTGTKTVQLYAQNGDKLRALFSKRALKNQAMEIVETLPAGATTRTVYIRTAYKPAVADVSAMVKEAAMKLCEGQQCVIYSAKLFCFMEAMRGRME